MNTLQIRAAALIEKAIVSKQSTEIARLSRALRRTAWTPKKTATAEAGTPTTGHKVRTRLQMPSPSAPGRFQQCRCIPISNESSADLVHLAWILAAVPKQYL